MKWRHGLLGLMASGCSLLVWGQGFVRPPAFVGGVPGMYQFQALETQRHQSRTLLYQEALEELRKNPQAADVAACPSGGQGVATCIPAAVLVEEVPVAQAVRHRYAVLVGNNGYTLPIPPLETPQVDVTKIGALLQKRFGFEVHLVKDGKKADILQAVKEVAAKTTPEDSVLVMYAGHGYLMDDTKMGFWIPVDGSVKTAANWISNTDIAKFLAAIPARQVVLVSDSCFSGSLVREQKMSQRVALGREDILRRRSVLVLSSGGEEPVSDEGKDGHSIFAWSLIDTLQTLEREAPGFEVYRVVKEKVMKDYPQEPQYGGVVAAGHVPGGDYLLERQ